MDDNNHLVIMAGGQGQRFWPWSNRALPKQFHDFLATGTTLLQATAKRFESLVHAHHVWVVTQERYRPIVQKQLPWIVKTQILCEPVARSTAACVAYACATIEQVCPAAKLIVVPADHVIQKQALLVQAIRQALQFAEDHTALILLGVPCQEPAVGYGYIGYDPHSPTAIRPIIDFVEKPAKERAQGFIESGHYVWNTGIFMGTLRTFINTFQTYLPALWSSFERVYASFSGDPSKTLASLQTLYASLPAVSFDEAILEKASSCYVLCADFGWLDLGTWKALYDYLPHDEADNVCQGSVVTLATRGCFIKANPGQLVVAYGVDQLVVVQQGTTLLICPKDKIQNLKDIINKLDEQGYEDAL